MTDDQQDFPVPAQRDLPADVRERLRTTVVSGLDHRPRRSPARGRLAAALGVVLLVAGGVLIARSMRDNRSVSVAGAKTPVTASTDADVTRCRAALADAGLTSAWPDPSDWRPMFNVSDGGRRVTAVLAGSQPMFCETTLTTVTVSSPDQDSPAAGGSVAYVLLGSDDGVVAGVVQPGTDRLDVEVRDGTGDYRRTATVGHGMFVAFGPPHGVRQSKVTVSAHVSANPAPTAAAEWSLPLPTPAPMLFQTDHPDPPDSDAAEDECVGLPAGLGGPVLDAASWRHGASVTPSQGTTIYVDYNSSAAALCESDADPDTEPDFRYLGPLPRAGGVPLKLAYQASPDGTNLTLAGLVSPDVTRVELTTPTDSRDALLVAQTFATTLPDAAKSVQVTVFGQAGQQLYQGQLPAVIKGG